MAENYEECGKICKFLSFVSHFLLLIQNVALSVPEYDTSLTTEDFANINKLPKRGRKLGRKAMENPKLFEGDISRFELNFFLFILQNARQSLAPSTG